MQGERRPTYHLNTIFSVAPELMYFEGGQVRKLEDQSAEEFGLMRINSVPQLQGAQIRALALSKHLS